MKVLLSIYLEGILIGLAIVVTYFLLTRWHHKRVKRKAIEQIMAEIKRQPNTVMYGGAVHALDKEGYKRLAEMMYDVLKDE